MSIRISPWNLVIQLTLFAGVGVLKLASSTNNEKYVAAAYFEKHNRLVDSDFEDLIVSKVAPLDTRLSALKRDLIGEGSHRQLSTYIQLDIRLTKQIQQFGEWEIIVLERLPSGVFADPFELQHLLSRGKFRDVAVFGDTNLELPSVASNRCVVELHVEIDHNVSSSKLEVSTKLPLHARYAPVIEEEEEEEEEKLGLWRRRRRIEFNEPDVLIRRIGKREDDDDDDDDEMYTLRGISSSNGGEVGDVGVAAWEVPSGIKSHSSFVSVVTFIAAVVSAFIIVLTSIRY